MGRAAYLRRTLRMRSCDLPPRTGTLGGTSTDRRGSLEMDLNIFKTWLKARLGIQSERGATMVEYVLILALIAIFVIGIVGLLGKSVSNKFSQASSGLG